MLDAFIIDQLKKNEEKERSKWEPLPLHLPFPEQDDQPTREDEEEDKPTAFRRLFF